MGLTRDGTYLRGRTWWITYTGPDGRRRWESARTPRKGEATALLERRRVDARGGQAPPSGRPMTLRELTERYAEVAKARPSWQPVGRFLVAQLVKRFGPTPIVRLGTHELQRYQAELAGRTKRPLKPASINRLVGQLKAMLTAAVDWRLLPDGFRDQLRRVKPIAGAGKRTRYLNDEEIKRLLAACAPPPKCLPPLPWNPMLRPLIGVALATGMRKSELFRLEWKDIDPEGLVYVRTSKNGEPRTLWIGPELLEELRAMRVHRPPGCDLVFPSPKGGRQLTSIQTAWEKARKAAGLEDVHLHDLRHTAASRWAMAGLTTLELAKLLGHKTLAMVQRYAHLAPGHGPDALRRLAWSPPSDRDKKVTNGHPEPPDAGKEKAPGLAPGAGVSGGGRYRT